jgi:hypothetical protein
MAVSTGNYVRWDDPAAESGAGPEEDKVINEVANQIKESQSRVLDSHHHAFSGESRVTLSPKIKLY